MWNAFVWLAVFDFSQMSDVLALDNQDPRLRHVLDADQFVKDLKDLDPQNWDPLPCNIVWDIHEFLIM